LWGSEYDRLAWKGLTGEIGKEEIIHELRMAGSLKGVKAMGERRAYLMENDPEYAYKTRENIKKVQPQAVTASLSKKARDKRIESFNKIEHQKGENNSQHGTMWITDGKQNRKINRTEEIPESFRRGRTLPPIKDKLSDSRLESLRKSVNPLNTEKWMCLETGYVSTAGGLHSYQRSKGIDPSKRAKVF